MPNRNLPQWLIEPLKPLARFVRPKTNLPSGQCLPISPALRQIHTQREGTIGLIDQCAKNGFVPDAHVYRLHETHVAELAEQRRMVGDAQARHAACLRRLEARFPEPPQPEPVPTPPRAPRVYPRIGNVLGGNGAASQPH